MEPTPESETHQLLNMYARLYETHTGHPATIAWAKDGKLAKDLLAVHPFAHLAQWLREFFDSVDPWIQEQGRTFGGFKIAIPKLIAAAQSRGGNKTTKLLKGIYYDAQQTRTPVRDALAFLAVSFNKMDMEAPQTRSYERALADVKDRGDILQKAAELLIDEAANGRQFYPLPKPSDVKGACAKVIEVMRLKAFMEAAHVCDHSPRFFEEIEDGGRSYMKRCSHWQLGKAAMEQVARLELPPSPDVEDNA